MLLDIGVWDAYGACFEFNEPEYIARHNTLEGYVPHHNHPGLKPGMYTDDTQMSVGIAEVILGERPWTREKLADKFVECFHRDPRRGYAGRFYEFLLKTKTSEAFLRDIVPASERSGAAMRAGVLGLIQDIEEVVDAAQYQAAITHYSEGGLLSATAAALMVHFFYHQGGKRADLAKYVADMTKHDWTKPWKGKVGVLGVPCVHAAITAIVQNESSSSILKQCISYTGDVDTVAAIAGAAVSVCEDVVQDTPAVLYETLENGTYGRDYLRKLDAELFKKFPKV